MKKKKVALIGNMNNNSFAILRYLLENNIDAELLLLHHEHEHFLPQNDTFCETDFPVYVSEYGMLPSSMWNLNKKKVKTELAKYDFIIGSGPAPAVLKLINRKLDIFIPYGSDIYFTPFIPIKSLFPIKNAIKKFYLRYLQRRGIIESKLIILDLTNDKYELLYNKLGINNKRYYNNIPFIYSTEFNPDKISKYYSNSIFFKEFYNIRQKNQLVVFHHCRHEWTDDRVIKADRNKHTKGNYKLIEGFSKFVRKNPNFRAHLVLFDYGADVLRSKKLIEILNLDSHVTWMPKMPRKEILVGISLCDIGVGELDSSYFSYGVIFEFLALAKPIIHHRNDKLYKDKKKSMYPMFNANTSEQIFEIFMKFKSNPKEFIEIGKTAHQWFLEEAITKPLKLIINKINESSIN